MATIKPMLSVNEEDMDQELFFTSSIWLNILTRRKK